MNNFRINPLEALPPISAKEIALMTKEEFLEFRNPGNKFHEADSYDFDLSDLNKNYKLKHIAEVSNDYRFEILKSGENYIIQYAPTRDDPKKLAAIIHEGTLYYSNPSIYHRLPTGYLLRDTEHGIWIKFNIAQKIRVKYLEEYLTLIHDIKKENLTRYPYLYQNILIQKEPYEIRMKEKPVLNKGSTIVIINKTGEVVAQAADEWGATLITVASEYRGRGLGKIIGQIWYQWNPEYPSGGFTASGRANAIAIWEDRVREFLHKGWYSELIKHQQLTKNRFKEIISGLSVKKKKEAFLSPKVVEKKPLIFVEKEQGYWGPTFVIYDEAFYQEEDKKHIYGFGFFRESEPVGSFLYTIDYDRPFTKLTTYVALQIARNNEEKIYIGPGYGDMLEIEGLQHIQVEGDYVSLTEDVLDLDMIRKLELIVRRKNDQYDEKYIRLLEMAHAKWGLTG